MAEEPGERDGQGERVGGGGAAGAGAAPDVCAALGDRGGAGDCADAGGRGGTGDCADAGDRGGTGDRADAGDCADAGDTAAARLTRLFEARRLTPTQRRIAHCLVHRAADAPFLSSVELAELAGVSQPSVTRFAVALGFDGYPALRRRLREAVPAAEPGGTGGDTWNTYQRAVRAEIENLRRLAALLADPAPVRRAGALLAASRPLPVLGLRAAGAQAAGFAYFAAKVHPDVRPLTEGGSMLGDRLDAAVRAGATALLCFALPRHPRETLDALATARAAGLTVITVADSAFAPVAADSDLLLPAAVGTGLAFDTACAPMLLGRVLLEAMCDGLPEAPGLLERFDMGAASRGLFAE